MCAKVSILELQVDISMKIRIDNNYVTHNMADRRSARPQCFQRTDRKTRTLCNISASLNGRSVSFNDALNTFYLRLYGVRHMVKDHSDSERGNPLPSHGLLFPISRHAPSHRQDNTYHGFYSTSRGTLA